jgi:hypothetical protein
MPAKAGIQPRFNVLKSLDNAKASRRAPPQFIPHLMRGGNDDKGTFSTFYKTIKIYRNKIFFYLYQSEKAREISNEAR